MGEAQPPDASSFLTAFPAGLVSGFAIVNEDPGPTFGVPFVSRKYDDGHLWIDVFETYLGADCEKAALKTTFRFLVTEVTAAEVRTFAAVGYFGMPARVFLHDRHGARAFME